MKDIIVVKLKDFEGEVSDKIFVFDTDSYAKIEDEIKRLQKADKDFELDDSLYSYLFDLFEETSISYKKIVFEC